MCHTRFPRVHVYVVILLHALHALGVIYWTCRSAKNAIGPWYDSAWSIVRQWSHCTTVASCLLVGRRVPIEPIVKLLTVQRNRVATVPNFLIAARYPKGLFVPNRCLPNSPNIGLIEVSACELPQTLGICQSKLTVNANCLPVTCQRRLVKAFLL